MTRVAVKRLKKEYDEIEKATEELPFTVHPLEDNFLEWHFTLQGPCDGPYQNGLYHGRLIFQTDYPFSPPTLMFLTPSARFQTNTKICLSVTGFHPEHWQPAWGVRTMLIAIRDHFGVEDRGAIGYVAGGEEERRRLAALSRNCNCKACGYQALGDISSLNQPNPFISHNSTSIKRDCVPPVQQSFINAQNVGLFIGIGLLMLMLFANYFFN